MRQSLSRESRWISATEDMLYLYEMEAFVPTLWCWNDAMGAIGAHIREGTAYGARHDVRCFSLFVMASHNMFGTLVSR